MDLLASLRERTEQAEVFTIESESTELTFEANEMKSAEVEETQGVALRAVAGGRLGFTAASGNVVEDKLIDNLLASAQFGDEVPIVFPGPTATNEVDLFDASLAETPIAHLAEIGHEVIERLLQVDSDSQVSVSIERGVSRSSVRNSAGAETEEHASSFSVGIGVERVRGDDVLMVYGSCYDISLTEDYRQIVERLAVKIELARKSAQLESGRMPVLFTPTGALVLLMPIMLGINGQNVQRGTSPLANRLGEAVFDPALTLWDDPTLAGRPASSRHDDEGVPCHRKALIERGQIGAFIYDLRTAALMGCDSTGNGQRGLFSTPSPSFSNLVLEPGTTPLADIVAGIDHGLLVDSVLGLGQGNALSGAFSNTVGLAYVIEGGEIVGRVKDVSIAGNIYEALREVAAITCESQWVRGHIRVPHILLQDLNVVAKR